MSRFKFLSSKMQVIKPDFYVVDKAKSATLYADIVAGKELVPEGSVVVLKDGATVVSKIAVNASKWADAIPFSGTV